MGLDEASGQGKLVGGVVPADIAGEPGVRLYEFKNNGGQVIYRDEIVDFKDTRSRNADGSRAFVGEARATQNQLLRRDRADFGAATRDLRDRIATMTADELALLDGAIVPDSGGKSVRQWLVDNGDASTAPNGFTWHHDLRTGNFHLVHTTIHGTTRSSHVGGAALWGFASLEGLERALGL